jgi:hypothetical protein
MDSFQVIFIIIAGITISVRWNALSNAFRDRNSKAIKGELALFLLLIMIGIGLQYFHYLKNE